MRREQLRRPGGEGEKLRGPAQTRRFGPQARMRPQHPPAIERVAQRPEPAKPRETGQNLVSQLEKTRCHWPRRITGKGSQKSSFSGQDARQTFSGLLSCAASSEFFNLAEGRSRGRIEGFFIGLSPQAKADIKFAENMRRLRMPCLFQGSGKNRREPEKEQESAYLTLFSLRDIQTGSLRRSRIARTKIRSSRIS